MTLNPTTGVLSGTPTTPGTFSFTIRAANGVTPDANSRPLTITVAPAPAPPTFFADSPPATATVGTAYGPYAFTATGNPTPTFTLGSGALPTGLTLDPTTGLPEGRRTGEGSISWCSPSA